MKTNRFIMLLVLACSLAYISELESRMLQVAKKIDWTSIATPNDSSSQHSAIPRLFASN